MEYNSYQLQDVCSFIDYRGKTPPKTTEGIPLITAKIIKNGTILPPQEFIPTDYYDEWMRRGIPKKGSVVFTTEAPLGEVAQIKTDERIAFAQRVIILEPNPNILDENYLLYALQDQVLKERIKARATGTTVIGIKVAEFKKVIIDLPPMDIQKKISTVLHSFDDKIELNQWINDNLFEQLFALYDNLVNGHNISHEVKLRELCSFQEGYVNPAQTHPEYFDGDIKWLRAVDINESFISDTSRTLTQIGFESAKKSAVLFHPNTIAISKSGTIGRLGIISDYMCGNRAVINIAPFNSPHLPFVYSYLKGRQREFADMAVGSVQKNLYVSLLEPLLVPVPEHSALDEFCETGMALFQTIQNNCTANKTIGVLRDTLLPKLMSGEIDVSSIQI